MKLASFILNEVSLHACLNDNPISIKMVLQRIFSYLCDSARHICPCGDAGAFVCCNLEIVWPLFSNSSDHQATNIKRLLLRL